MMKLAETKGQTYADWLDGSLLIDSNTVPHLQLVGIALGCLGHHSHRRPSPFSSNRQFPWNCRPLDVRNWRVYSDHWNTWIKTVPLKEIKQIKGISQERLLAALRLYDFICTSLVNEHFASGLLWNLHAANNANRCEAQLEDALRSARSASWPHEDAYSALVCCARVCKSKGSVNDGSSGGGGDGDGDGDGDGEGDGDGDGDGDGEGDGDGRGDGDGDGNGDGHGDGETNDKQTSDDDAIQHFLRGAAAARNLGLYANLNASKIIAKNLENPFVPPNKKSQAWFVAPGTFPPKIQSYSTLQK